MIYIDGGNMKKGFTLIELLIVLVIVAVLVTVSVPKYKVAMEKTRGMEAVTNLKMLADYLNARYVIQGNTYCPSGGCSKLSGFTNDLDLLHSTYFNRPAISGSPSASQVTMSTSRAAGGKSYTVSVTVSNGTKTTLCCSGDSVSCKALGGESTGGCSGGAWELVM